MSERLDLLRTRRGLLSLTIVTLRIVPDLLTQPWSLFCRFRVLYHLRGTGVTHPEMDPVRLDKVNPEVPKLSCFTVTLLVHESRSFKGTFTEHEFLSWRSFESVSYGLRTRILFGDGHSSVIYGVQTPSVEKKDVCSGE